MVVHVINIFFAMVGFFFQESDIST